MWSEGRGSTPTRLKNKVRPLLSRLSLPANRQTSLAQMGRRRTHLRQYQGKGRQGGGRHRSRQPHRCRGVPDQWRLWQRQSGANRRQRRPGTSQFGRLSDCRPGQRWLLSQDIETKSNPSKDKTGSLTPDYPLKSCYVGLSLSVTLANLTKPNSLIIRRRRNNRVHRFIIHKLT